MRRDVTRDRMLGTVTHEGTKDMSNTKLGESLARFILADFREAQQRGGITVRRHDSINIAFLEVQASLWEPWAVPPGRNRLDAQEFERTLRELEYVLRHPEVRYERTDHLDAKHWKVTGPMPRTVPLSYANRQSVDRVHRPGRMTASLDVEAIDDAMVRTFAAKTQYITEAMLKASLALPDAVTRFVKQAADEELEAAKRRFPMMMRCTPLYYGLDMGLGKSIDYTDFTVGYKEEKPVLKKVNNAFYVASPNVTTPREQDQKNTEAGQLATLPNGGGRWTRPTLNAAIDHANAMLDKDPSLEHVAITKIVRIVRRRKLPNVVEVVK